ERHADDVRMEDHGAADETLHVEDDLPAVELEALADHHQAIAGPDLAAKADVLHAAEAQEIAVDQTLGRRIIGADLGGRLAHEHAGHQWIARHVAAHPELVGADVLVANDDLRARVDVDDRVELLHLEALRV